MARGVRIKGSDLQIQIDNNYINYTYYEHDSYEIGIGDTVIPITSTPDTVLVAFRPTTGGWATNWGLEKTGSNYTGVRMKSDAVQTVDYIVFRDNQTPTLSGTTVLKIYKTGSSDVAFDSRNNYMNVVGAYQGSTGNFTVDDATNNYFMYYGFGTGTKMEWSEYVGDGEWTNTFNGYGLKKINSTTLNVGNLVIHQDTFPWGGSGAGYTGGNYSGNQIVLEFKGV